MAGRGQASGGKPLCRKAAKSPEERSLSHKSRDGASERRFLLLPRRVFRRSISPQSRGERTKSLNSRGGAGMRALGCLKFESENTQASTDTPPSSSRKRGPIHTNGSEADGVSDSRNQPANL